MLARNGANRALGAAKRLPLVWSAVIWWLWSRADEVVGIPVGEKETESLWPDWSATTKSGRATLLPMIHPVQQGESKGRPARFQNARMRQRYGPPLPVATVLLMYTTVVQGLFPLAPPYGVSILERVGSWVAEGAPPAVADAPGRLGSAFRGSIENADAVVQGFRDAGSQAGASVRDGLSKLWESRPFAAGYLGEGTRPDVWERSPEHGERASSVGSKTSRAIQAGPENLLPRFFLLGAYLKNGLRAVRRAPGTVKSRLVGKTATNATVLHTMESLPAEAADEAGQVASGNAPQVSTTVGAVNPTERSSVVEVQSAREASDLARASAGAGASVVAFMDGSLVEAAGTAGRIRQLQGTWAENLVFESRPDWDGQTLALGPLVEAKVDANLQSKLSFLGGDASPFAGKKILESLRKDAMTSKELQCDLTLLMAMECVSKDSDYAGAQLDEYLERRAELRGNASGDDDDASGFMAHPLALLAFYRFPQFEEQQRHPARLSPRREVAVGQAASLESGDWGLYAFATLYPRAVDRFCTQTEKEKIKAWRIKVDAEAREAREARDERARNATATLARMAEDSPSRLNAEDVDPHAPAHVQWQHLTSKYKIESRAVPKLLALAGLEKVKQAAVRLFQLALVLARMDPETRQKNQPSLNYCFVGNAGTGKTTVARLFGEILHETGLRGKKTFDECSAQELKGKGVSAFRQRLNAAKDGVVFIDELHALDCNNDKEGKAIGAELLVLAEKERETLSLILAGHAEETNENVFGANPGLRGRFSEIHLDDFDEPQLLGIWTAMLADRRFSQADGLGGAGGNEGQAGRVVVRRLLRGLGSKGFGNARAIRQKLDDAIQRATVRPDFDPANPTLSLVDVVGENPVENAKLRAVLAEINGKTGWGAVKTAVKELVELCEENHQRELRGQEALEVFKNRLFLGNPGTGKTTCARLYGQVLKHLDLLSNGDVVEKTASDLMGSVVGESRRKTADLLEACVGKVLVIDEAHTLDDSGGSGGSGGPGIASYGRQALDTIVEKVQSDSDIAVLLLGYTDEMHAMLRNQNPGLARRFDASQAFQFDDYSASELLQILQGYCEKKGLKPSIGFLEAAMDKLERQRRCEANFGNAGAVENLVKASIVRATARQRGWRKSLRASAAVSGPVNIGGNMTRELTVSIAVSSQMAPAEPDSDPLRLQSEDVDSGGIPQGQVNVADIFAPLDKLYRMHGVKDKLFQLYSAAQVAQADGDSPPPLGHFAFVGAPGTGKTTVARVVGEILFSLGLLAKKTVVETSGLDLTGEYLGQTKTKVTEKLKEALGGVLFIDEAYELGKGTYGSEACSTLVAAMTDPKYSSLAIVMAGYPADIMSMLDSNPGLKSRVNHFLEFPDWSPEDCATYFIRACGEAGFSFEGTSDDGGRGGAERIKKELLLPAFEKLRQCNGWGNARDVHQFLKLAKDSRATRLAAGFTDAASLAGGRSSTLRASQVGSKLLRGADVEHAAKTLIAARTIGGAGIASPVLTAAEEGRTRNADATTRPLEVNVRASEVRGDGEILNDTEDEEGLSDDSNLDADAPAGWADERARKPKATSEIAKACRVLGKCPMNFPWRQEAMGYRCSAGGHFVTHAELEQYWKEQQCLPC